MAGVDVTSPPSLSATGDKGGEKMNTNRISGISLPYKYRLLYDFITAMVDVMEEAEERYGDWREIPDRECLIERFKEEVEELSETNYQGKHELVDVANMCFLCWAYSKSDKIPRMLTEEDVKKMENAI